jgi:murein L,D-transpeptidase YafK
MVCAYKYGRTLTYYKVEKLRTSLFYTALQDRPGGNPVGPKERQGNLKTPEGTYIIDSRNGNSGFHLSLHISYPNRKDRLRAKELGVAPGGNIMIHGIKNGFAPIGAAHAEVDWIEGCIAVTSQEMEEIYKFVPNGTTVEIRL